MSSIYEYYTNPMDIVQFLDGDKAENLLRDVLHEATMFHAETGLSPIVKSDKYDSYSLDYFYLVSRLAESVFNVFEKQDEGLANEAKKQVMHDFGLQSDSNSKRLLINLLDYKGVVYSNNDKRWVYSLKRYRGRFNDRLFLVSGILIDSNFIKEKLGHKTIEQLEKMASNSQYILEAIGNKAMQVNFSASANQPVWSFS